MLRYRGRTITDEQVAFVRELLAAEPTASRQALSRKLCVAWGWRQANGVLSDMVCRSLLLKLERAGAIQLPPARRVGWNPLAVRPRPAPVLLDRTPIEGPLSALGPLTYRQVRRTAEEPIFNGLLEEHHYLGYMQPVGAHLKYLVYAGARPVAALSFCSAAFHLGVRDRFIGWSREARQRNLARVAYNSRFLILPWVSVPHLASHVLGVMARRVTLDWERMYRHRLCFLETFVDPERYRGTCYRAANWLVLGETMGRGHKQPKAARTRSIKQVLGYPLDRRFRELLCTVA
jgi:hypothetical protein